MCVVGFVSQYDVARFFVLITNDVCFFVCCFFVDDVVVVNNEACRFCAYF